MSKLHLSLLHKVAGLVSLETNPKHLQKVLRAQLYSVGLKESTNACNNLPKILKYSSIIVNVTHYRKYVLTKDTHTYIHKTNVT